MPSGAQPLAAMEPASGQPAPASPLLPPPPPPPDGAPASERDGLLAGHASRSCSPFHALEIQSDEGSSYEPHPKAVLAVGAAATDPTERLLPPPKQPDVELLPGGLTRQERLRMVILFSVTAAFLYAGALPWVVGFGATDAECWCTAQPPCPLLASVPVCLLQTRT